MDVYPLHIVFNTGGIKMPCALGNNPTMVLVEPLAQPFREVSTVYAPALLIVTLCDCAEGIIVSLINH